jgi:hypothetical protein
MRTVTSRIPLPFSVTGLRWCSSVQEGFGNLFAYLSMPLDAKCKVQDVQRKYHSLQATLHPDVAQQTTASPSTHTTHSVASLTSSRGVDSSSYANAAYETLRDPFTRCRYLLKYLVAEQRNGGPLNPAQEEAVYFSDDSRENLGGVEGADHGSSLDTNFLMEMMEYNEIVFSMDPEHPTEEDTETLSRLQEHIKEMDHRYEEESVAAWEERNVDRFRSAVLHWTYVNNLKKHIHQRK